MVHIQLLVEGQQNARLFLVGRQALHATHIGWCSADARGVRYPFPDHQLDGPRFRADPDDRINQALAVLLRCEFCIDIDQNRIVVQRLAFLALHPE